MVFWENQKVVLAYYAQCVKPVCEAHGLTRMEFDILLFLANNPVYDTAADIVRIRMLTKSHVSGALKRLETDGKQLFDGFSPEQLDMLKQLLQRMYQNARLGMTEEKQ